MDSYTLIFVRDQRARPVQVAIPKQRVKQAMIGAAVALLVGAVLVWDYWRLRADNAELAELRVEAMEQREQITVFRNRLVEVDAAMSKVGELERKVRIIANVPIEAATVPEGMNGQGGGQPLPRIGEEVSGIDVLDRLEPRALELASSAEVRVASLEGLLDQLDDKRQRLVSMPSIWPAKGWLTSRYGPRVSPFTGRRQLHAGIDIAAASGTSIYAPARGRVTFVGKKGPLGKALVVDHGFGVKTIYGHTKEIHVSPGDVVERGQEIAAIGSTGRSTGPHLHYVVEVNGKARDPLDYIFD